MLDTSPGLLWPAEARELQQLADRLDQFERRLLTQLHPELIAAEARQAIARCDEVAMRLTQVLAAAQRLNDTLHSPRAVSITPPLAVIRTLRQELVRPLTYAASGIVVLLLVTFVFVLSR